MSAFLLKNNLNKRYFNSCYQLTKKFKTLIINGPKTANSKLFQQSIPANLFVLRELSSNALRINQYQTSRKYTVTWKLERLMGWSLIILIPMAFAIDSKILEMALGTSALLHTYWGCQSMCSDYLRSHVVGKLLPIIARVSVIFLCLFSLAGLRQLVYEDVGLINMIKKFWSIRGQDYVPPKHLKNVEQKQNIRTAFERPSRK